MFRAIIDDVSLLRDSLDSVSNFINEGTFTINNNGLSLIAMDPANIAMIIYNLLASAFTQYESTSEAKITFNIPYFVSILKRAGANDSVELKLVDGANALTIKMTGDSTRTFTLPLMDPHGSPVKPPKELDEGFKAEVEVEASTVKEGTKDALMVSDSVLFTCDGNSFVMKALSDTNEVNLQLTHDSPSLLSINASEPVKSKYSLEYLDKMMKVSKISKTVFIKFANDYPLRLDYKTMDKLRLSFILAPRVEVD